MRISEGNAIESVVSIENVVEDQGVPSASYLGELEQRIERGLQAFLEVGQALLEIRDQRLYRSRGFRTFEDYCRERWGWGRHYAYRQMDAAKVVANLLPMGNIPVNERQCREIASLEPDQQRQVAKAIQASGETFESVSSSQVREAAEQVRASSPSSLGVHFSSDSCEWYSPRGIINPALQVFGGEIDLDPCSNSHEAPNVPAATHFTVSDDGLEKEWHGRVFMNPPYHDRIPVWIQKLTTEYREKRVSQAIALVPARTDTEWFGSLWDYTICFLRGRLKFSGHQNSAPFPSAVVYMGPHIDEFDGVFAVLGAICVRRQGTWLEGQR